MKRLNVGDELIISFEDLDFVEDKEEWIFARNKATQDEGYVPSNFLQISTEDDTAQKEV